MVTRKHKVAFAALLLGGVFVAGGLPFALTREYVATVELIPVRHDHGTIEHFYPEALPRIIYALEEWCSADWNAEGFRRKVLSDIGGGRWTAAELKRILSSMTIEPHRSKGVVKVSVSASSAHEAVLLANAYARAAIRHLEAIQAESMQKGIAQVKEMLERARRQRGRLEGEVAALRSAPRTETDEPSGALQMASNRCANIEKDLKNMELRCQQKIGEIGFEVVAWADEGGVERKYALFPRWNLWIQGIYGRSE